MRQLLTLVAIVATGAGACSPGAVASLLPGGAPLLTMTARGGECFEPPCESTVAIDRSGAVRQTFPTDAGIGEVPPALLIALDGAVKTTDYAALRSRPFTGECPTAFDGQEFVWEFGAPTGVERIASCETEIDPAHPLFAAASAALEAAGAAAPVH